MCAYDTSLAPCGSMFHDPVPALVSLMRFPLDPVMIKAPIIIWVDPSSKRISLLGVLMQKSPPKIVEPLTVDIFELSTKTILARTLVSLPTSIVKSPDTLNVTLGSRVI
ncbi:MAG: hypothetical protein BWY68_00756 [bacterium ADurb.Bin400]|nr:MAG: hypothetical protein BWY68_00756 [bacterium ADurb.Bin400]